MALNIKHGEADRLARKISAMTGETLTEAVVTALRERLARVTVRRPAPLSVHDICAESRTRLARLPLLDPRPADEILGYDEAGLPR
jgi:antitoxin VapB